ncbi:MAG: peroxiredoxin [Bacteroidetes Order II. Incertae sedis bacterium]|nr:peroxiredoxin [Bacteroidetes Order II. bacterium]
MSIITLKVGDPAPLFSATTFDGQTISLEKLRGKKVVLYFYPEDDTDVCTRQACNLRDNHALLQDKGMVVIGVSPDENPSHGAFTQKFGLPFALLPDPDHVILDAYGTFGEKNMYGNIVQGVLRYTFLIDEAGIIRHIFRKPRVNQHAEEILKKFGLA